MDHCFTSLREGPREVVLTTYEKVPPYESPLYESPLYEKVPIFTRIRGETVALDSQPRLESKHPPSSWRLVRGLSRFLHDVYRGVSSTVLRRLELKDLPTLRRLGRGMSGFVYETTWKGNRYARKDFPLGSDEDKSVFKNEVKYLFNLDHQNIAKCVGYTVGKSSCSLLQEYVDDNLHNTIQKTREVQRLKNLTSASRSQVKERENFGVGNEAGSSETPGSTETSPFQAPQVVDIMSQIAAAMEYLHDRGVVHGDLKPRNVLVCSASDDVRPKVMEPDRMIVKVADFGLVETKKRIKLVPEQIRNSEMLWKAPELFSKASSEDLADPPRYSDQDEFLKSKLTMADVYSFGLTCAHVLRGMLTSPDSSFGQLQQSQSREDLLPSDCPKYLKDLICSCLGSEALSRPTFSYICSALQAWSRPSFSNIRFPLRAGEVKFRDEIVKINRPTPMRLPPLAAAAPPLYAAHSNSNLIHQGRQDQLQEKRSKPLAVAASQVAATPIQARFHLCNHQTHCSGLQQLPDQREVWEFSSEGKLTLFPSVSEQFPFAKGTFTLYPGKSLTWESPRMCACSQQPSSAATRMSGSQYEQVFFYHPLHFHTSFGCERL